MLPLAILTAGLLGTSDDLVREVVVGHQATVESIRTFAAKVTFSDPSQPGLEVSHCGPYYRAGDQAATRAKHPDGGSGHVVQEPGRLRSVCRTFTGLNGRRLPQPDVTAGIHEGTHPLGIDVWANFAIAFETSTNRYESLGVAVAKPWAAPSADRVTVDGRPLVRLRYTYRLTPEYLMHATQWHDPGRGYLVVRRDVKPADGSPRGGRAEFTDFASVGGIEFPTRVVRTGEGPDAPGPQTTTLTDVQINQPLPADTFDLTLPAGTHVTDSIRGAEYNAGPDWTPIGPEKPWSVMVFAAPAAVKGTSTGQSPSQETRGWPFWLTLASAALLVAGGTAAVVRRSGRPRAAA